MSTMQSEASLRAFELEERGETTVVKLARIKIIEDRVVQLLGEQLFALLDGDRKSILIDFQELEFLSAPGLGEIIRFQSETEAAGIRLALRGIRPEIYEVFKVTKLNEQFNIQQ